MKYLLDTNALSEPIRPKPREQFLKRYERHASELAISAITWQEAVFGLHRMPDGRRKQAVGSYLRDVVQANTMILPYDAACAEWHAREAARLEAKGVTPSHADAQIAAVAVINGLVLVTANTRHFTPFDGLSLADWTE